MSYSEITVSIGKHTFPLYLQPGFFNPSPTGSGLHKHRYTEIHLIASGRCVYRIGTGTVTVEAGQAVAIPKGEFHHCIFAEPGARNTAFQIPYPLTKPICKTFSPEFTETLLKKIQECPEDGTVATMLATVCAEFFHIPSGLRPLRDPVFIIHERLDNEYYKDLTLADLATDLELSKKQTQRLIVKHTGNTFRAEIAKRRMEAARHLLQTEDVTLAEAAERVGYRSYSGFWKAFRTDRKTTEKEP